MNLSALIMGAGLSSRLVGANKLLLDWLGKPILLHTVSNVLEAGFKETLLVLGNDKDKIKSALKSYGNEIKIITNPFYKEGLTSSIQQGVNASDNQTDGFDRRVDDHAIDLFVDIFLVVVHLALPLLVFGFILVTRFSEIFEARHLSGPIGAVFRGPALVNHLDRRGVEIELARAAVFFGDDEVRLFQHCEMLHDGDAADIEFAGERANADARFFLYDIEHASAAFMGERLKHGVHIFVIQHR